MQRRLLPGPLSRFVRSRYAFALQGAAVAAAPHDSQLAAEGPSQDAPKAQSGAAVSQATTFGGVFWRNA